MPEALVAPICCEPCYPCCDPVSVTVPGPQGEPGTPGTDGTDGVNAFTGLALAFTMPAHLGTANATVDDASWMTVGEPVFVETLGVLLVTNKAGNVVTLQNLATNAGAYALNAAPATIAAPTDYVTPTGWQGPPGTDGTSGAPDTATYIIQQVDAGLPAAQSLGALIGTGLLKNTIVAAVGTLSKAVDGTDYLSPLTGLIPADIGSTVQAHDALLDNIATLGIIADRIIYGTGPDTVALATLSTYMRGLLASASAAAARAALGISAVPTVTKIASYSATIADGLILCDATAGVMTIGLPSAATATGIQLTVKKIDVSGNVVTLDGNLGEFIDGALTQALAAQWDVMSVICNGTAWYIV